MADMKKKFINLKNWIVSHAPTKRRLIQLYSALLFNANLKGYITGDIFKGATKNMCTPGLNCYSCPGAVTACPMGALQNAFAESEKRTPYYVFGILMLYGIMLGRWICGWLCPFGLVQDLLHKIKTPKLKKSRVTRVLSYFKYVILVLFAVIFPVMYAIKDFPLPGFCKYICPAGTFGGALGLLINPENGGMFDMLGPLFTWKFVLMVSFIVSAVFIYRVFCRFFCPLGAIYGLFNRFALFGIKLEKKSCINCGKCITVCKMDIKSVGDHECINCGDCVAVCPTKAISWRGSSIILPPNEIPETEGEQEREEAIAKRDKRTLRIKIATVAVMAAVLVGALVYFNFIHENPPTAEIGNAVGDECYSMDLELIDGSGTVNIADLRGKVVVINFWGTWCGPCKAELPHFNQVASEYEGEVVILTVHTSYGDGAVEYVEENYPDTSIVWVYDTPLNDYADTYYTTLGGKASYPMTLVLDADGVITFTREGSMSHEELVGAVEAALNK